MQYYNDRNKFAVTILLNINNNNRFKDKLDFTPLGVKVLVLEYNVAKPQYDPVIKETLEKLAAGNWSKFVFFLEQAPVNQFLAVQLSKKGTTICVAPEGTKPYITISKAALPSRIRATLQNYRFLKTQRLLFGIPPLVSNVHGFLKQTDEVWVHNPDIYHNSTHKKVVQVDLFTSADQTKTVSEIFNFHIEQHLPEVDGILFYLNQWYVEFKVYDFELEVLQALLDKYPNKKICIKLHPNTHKFQVERFEKMDRVILNRVTVPAELFIINLSNSIIFSFWSASLLIKNDSCKFYWLHTLLEKQKLMDWWSIKNPVRHIKEVNSIDEIVF